MAACRNTGSFDKWLADFKREAAAQKISAAAIAAASPYLTFEQRIINIDRGQKFFAQNFLDFSKKTIPAYRLQRGGQLIKKHQDIFQRIEKDFGVPAPVIVAFLGTGERFWRRARARSRCCVRWRRSPMTAAAPSCSARACSTRCA